MFLPELNAIVLMISFSQNKTVNDSVYRGHCARWFLSCVQTKMEYNHEHTVKHVSYYFSVTIIMLISVTEVIEKYAIKFHDLSKASGITD